MINIPSFKRKEPSIYKPTDLWTKEDDLLFLKYCPNKRDKCYHTMSSDLSARPSEILNLKIKDVVFKTNGTQQYAEVLVNGKTGSRPIPLFSSVPYIKDWLDSHPQRGNKNTYLIPSLDRRSRNFGYIGHIHHRLLWLLFCLLLLLLHRASPVCFCRFRYVP